MGIFSQLAGPGTLGLSLIPGYGPVLGMAGGAILGGLAAGELNEEKMKQRKKEMELNAALVGTDWARNAPAKQVDVTPYEGPEAAQFAGAFGGMSQGIKFNEAREGLEKMKADKALTESKTKAYDKYANAGELTLDDEASPTRGIASAASPLYKEGPESMGPREDYSGEIPKKLFANFIGPREDYSGEAPLQTLFGKFIRK